MTKDRQWGRLAALENVYQAARNLISHKAHITLRCICADVAHLNRCTCGSYDAWQAMLWLEVQLRQLEPGKLTP